MTFAPGIGERAHDLAAIIDSLGLGSRSVREIDRCEIAVISEIPVEYISGVSEAAHNLAAIIDSKRIGKRSAWDIDLGESSEGTG